MKQAIKWLIPILVVVSAAPYLAAQEISKLVRRFPVPANPIEISQAARQGRFFDTMARRAGILGFEGEAFEAWVYPLKLFHDCRIRATLQETGEVVDLGSRVDWVTVRPESVTLTATHSLFTVREIFFTPLEQSGSVLLLDIDSARPLTLTVSFVPDLKPMWPAGLGGQYAAWSDERRLFIISESRRKYSALVGCPAAVRGSATPAHELGKGAVSFDIKVDPAAARKAYYPVVIAGSMTGRDAAHEAYDNLLRTIPQEYEKLVQHYRRIHEERIHIETPEPDLNMGLEWAKVAIDKGFVHNPDLGSGLIAGWGPSGESARPGFGWFFGGDTFLNQYAISGMGDFSTMRQAFRFLRQRQRADGKMMHELTQAAGWIPWFEEYPYGYYHGDTTPFYIASFFDYYKQSGDSELLKESWDSLKRAYAFCKSTDEDGDGLMDNTRAGLGASELGSLLEDLKTDILLGALSPAAWRAIAAMAGETGDAQMRDEARALYRKALKAANDRFWSPDLRSLVHALTVSGGQNREITAWPALGIMLGIFAGPQADATAEMMASAALSTDWGSRMLANTSKAYDPAAYNNGAVWPFLTGLVAAAEYACHRSFSGYQLLLANARLTWAGALGYHPELISGDYYRPLETAVPHQLFSSAGIITPLVRGLLGLSGDAREKMLSFMPHIPPGWKVLRIRHYRIGGDTFDILMEKTPQKLRYVIEGGQVGYRLRLSPALGLFSAVRKVRINGKDSPFTHAPANAESQDVHYLITAQLEPRTEIEIEYEPGIELDAPLGTPLPGSPSSNPKILGVRADGDKISVLMEGLAGRAYLLRAWTSLPITEVNGGELQPSDPPSIKVTFPDSDTSQFVRLQVQLKLELKKKPNFNR